MFSSMTGILGADSEPVSSDSTFRPHINLYPVIGASDSGGFHFIQAVILFVLEMINLCSTLCTLEGTRGTEM